MLQFNVSPSLFSYRYDDHANQTFLTNGGNSNGFDPELDEYDKAWTMTTYIYPAASFVADPFLLESDSSSSNLSDCVNRGVLDALYQTDI